MNRTERTKNSRFFIPFAIQQLRKSYFNLKDFREGLDQRIKSLESLLEAEVSERQEELIKADIIKFKIEGKDFMDKLIVKAKWRFSANNIQPLSKIRKIISVNSIQSSMFTEFGINIPDKVRCKS